MDHKKIMSSHNKKNDPFVVSIDHESNLKFTFKVYQNPVYRIKIISK